MFYCHGVDDVIFIDVEATRTWVHHSLARGSAIDWSRLALVSASDPAYLTPRPSLTVY